MRAMGSEPGLPYENATSGKGALDDMQRILRGFGASSFGSMEDFANGTLTVQFEYRGRRVTITASSKGYAAAWLKRHPYSSRTRGTQVQHQQKALKIGQVAVYSILRDWVKGQVTAVECGILSFAGAFLGQIMLPSGETVLQRVEAENLLALSGPET
jgi:hypothetical protein